MSFLNLYSYVGEKTDLMASGSLEEVPFYTILGKITKRRLSGKLAISRGERVKHVYFDRGQPTSIRSNLVAESLHSVILRNNLLKKDKLLEAVKDIDSINFLENLDFEQKLFLYLKQKNYLSKEELGFSLKQQFSERLLNLFGWFSGEYSFEKDSHLIYSLSSQTIPLKDIYTQVEKLLYPDKKEIKEEIRLSSVEGNFKDTFFPTLSKTLIDSGVTGKLILQKKDRIKTVRYQRGVPVSVDSDHPYERPGRLLVRLKLLKMDEWLKLEDEVKFVKTGILDLARTNGIITEKDVKLVKAISFIERYLELFAWRSGLYRFEARKSIKCPSCKTQIQIKFDLNPNKYSCPKCNCRLSGDSNVKAIKVNEEYSRSEISQPSKIEVLPLSQAWVEKSQPSIEEKKPVTGEIPQTHFCPECKKPIDPIIKKCVHCCEETLLDAYQMSDIGKKRKSRGLPDSHDGKEEKSVEKTQFDVLSNNILILSQDKSFKNIIFTGPLPKSGKSFVTLNCALSISENYNKRVLIIDADFLNPSMCLPLEVRPEYGLAEVLSEDLDLKDAIYETAYDNLFLLPIKEQISKPDKYFNKEKFEEVMKVAEKSFDYIMFDTSHIMPSNFERHILKSCDGIILVIRKGMISMKEIGKYIEKCDQSKIIGAVLNRIG